MNNFSLKIITRVALWQFCLASVVGLFLLQNKGFFIAKYAFYVGIWVACVTFLGGLRMVFGSRTTQAPQLLKAAFRGKQVIWLGSILGVLLAIKFAPAYSGVILVTGSITQVAWFFALAKGKILK